MLSGKAVLVTGAASGLGTACASLAAAEGARLVICDINEQRLREVAGGLDGEVHAEVCDVRTSTLRVRSSTTAPPASARSMG